MFLQNFQVFVVSYLLLQWCQCSVCLTRSRPHWDESTSSEVLQQAERDSFLEWRRELALYVVHHSVPIVLNTPQGFPHWPDTSQGFPQLAETHLKTFVEQL